MIKIGEIHTFYLTTGEIVRGRVSAVLSDGAAVVSEAETYARGRLTVSPSVTVASGAAAFYGVSEEMPTRERLSWEAATLPAALKNFRVHRHRHRKGGMERR